MFGWLARLFGRKNPHRDRFGLDELARRVGLPLAELQRIPREYREVSIPKRSGGVRTLSIPHPTLMTLQRRLLRRVLGKLHAHGAVYGFERGKSIVDHARQHVGRAVVVKFDLRDFFATTTAKRVNDYFRRLGWTDEAAALLTQLCTWKDSLPQGAPTSPRLSNLVNYALDAKLDRIVRDGDGHYSRYADDLTFSYDKIDEGTLGWLIQSTRDVCAQFGYRLNRRKTRIMRRHQRQQVTGLVVNDKVALPRETRRRLRAIEHQQRTRGESTLSESQLAGWQAFRSMIERE